RSPMAACTTAAASPDSQNAWIDTRGTGSIWAIGVVDWECARGASSRSRDRMGSASDAADGGNRRLPISPRVSALADLLDGAQPHGLVRRRRGATLHEIARVGDLRGKGRLGGATEI